MRTKKSVQNNYYSFQKFLWVFFFFVISRNASESHRWQIIKIINENRLETVRLEVLSTKSSDEFRIHRRSERRDVWNNVRFVITYLVVSRTNDGDNLYFFFRICYVKSRSKTTINIIIEIYRTLAVLKNTVEKE